MGERDSSKTRVAPVFQAMLDRDPTGRSWLGPLLDLPEGNAEAKAPIRSELGELRSWNWGDNEVRLAAPVALLQWLVEHIVLPPEKSLSGDSQTVEKRQSLLDKDPSTIREALQALDDAKSLLGQAWFILEGASQPDVFLDTPEVLIVIEGKRTEAGPTRKTTWKSVRDQMLRHIDCAWEIRGDRRVYGFMIVEGEGIDVPAIWRSFADETTSDAILNASLPHRSPNERKAIADAFLGIVTWQRVCGEFDIAWESLPDTVASAL